MRSKGSMWKSLQNRQSNWRILQDLALLSACDWSDLADFLDFLPPEKSFSVLHLYRIFITLRYGQACNTELEKQRNILTRIRTPSKKCECWMKSWVTWHRQSEIYRTQVNVTDWLQMKFNYDIQRNSSFADGISCTIVIEGMGARATWMLFFDYKGSS